MMVVSTGTGVTVRTAEPETRPVVAVMVVVPIASALARPLVPMVATNRSLDDQVVAAAIGAAN